MAFKGGTHGHARHRAYCNSENLKRTVDCSRFTACLGVQMLVVCRRTTNAQENNEKSNPDTAATGRNRGDSGKARHEVGRRRRFAISYFSRQCHRQIIALPISPTWRWRVPKRHLLRQFSSQEINIFSIRGNFDQQQRRRLGRCRVGRSSMDVAGYGALGRQTIRTCSDLSSIEVLRGPPRHVYFGP